MAGTVTITHKRRGQVRELTMVCVGDASDGTIPDTELPRIEGQLHALQTKPAAGGMTSNYDITIVDEDGIDVLQGAGANRHATNAERVPIVYSGTSIHPLVHGGRTLTLNVDNNSDTTSGVTIRLVYLAPSRAN